MIKPFTVNFGKDEKSESATQITPTNEVKKEAPKPTTVVRNGAEMVQPFTTIDTPTRKLYLLLKVYNDMDAGEGEAEQLRDFEFFTGTSQELYDKVRSEEYVADECKKLAEQLKEFERNEENAD